MRIFFKNINKFGLVAILFAGTTAFAFKAEPVKVNKFATNYFAVADNPSGTQWHWATSAPAGKSCSDGSATCEISTTVAGTPPANGFPSSYTVVQGEDKASVYQ